MCNLSPKQITQETEKDEKRCSCQNAGLFIELLVNLPFYESATHPECGKNVVAKCLDCDLVFCFNCATSQGHCVENGKGGPYSKGFISPHRIIQFKQN